MVIINRGFVIRQTATRTGGFIIVFVIVFIIGVGGITLFAVVTTSTGPILIVVVAILVAVVSIALAVRALATATIGLGPIVSTFGLSESSKDATKMTTPLCDLSSRHSFGIFSTLNGPVGNQQTIRLDMAMLRRSVKRAVITSLGLPIRICSICQKYRYDLYMSRTSSSNEGGIELSLVLCIIVVVLFFTLLSTQIVLGIRAKLEKGHDLFQSTASGCSQEKALLEAI